MRSSWYCTLLILITGLATSLVRAESVARESTPGTGIEVRADPPADEATVVVDVDGKETKLTGVKFALGTRRLAWLADPKGATEEERRGPLAMEFRETHSTTYTKGIVTLVPVAHVASVKYDYEKKTVDLGVKGLKEPLGGKLVYKGFNVMGFSGTVDGKTTTFSGGVIGKTPAVKSATFAGAKAVPEIKPTGTAWSIQIVQPLEKDPTITARNLKVLYQYTGGVERVEDAIPVRKGALLPLNGGIKRFEILASDPNTNMAAAEVVDPKTDAERIIVIPLTREQDKKVSTLVGFLGEVEAGWKFFPLHTIKVMTMTEVKRKVE